MRESISLARISKGTLKERVYGELRTALICGRIESGEAITIRGLAEAFGTSTTPVREAVQQLIAEKVLVGVANKEVRVPPISQEMFHQAYDIRIMLEGRAASLSAKLASDAELEEIGRLFEHLRSLRKKSNTEKMLLANMNWHFTIYKSSQQEYLTDVIESVWLAIGPIFSYPYRCDRKQRGAYIELVESIETKLIEALQARNARRSNALVKELLTKSRKWYDSNYEFK